LLALLACARVPILARAVIAHITITPLSFRLVFCALAVVAGVPAAAAPLALGGPSEVRVQRGALLPQTPLLRASGGRAPYTFSFNAEALPVGARGSTDVVLYHPNHNLAPAQMTAAELEYGYRWAYREFYRWKSIVRGASAHDDLLAGARHLAYAAGWKKFEPVWDFIIRARRAGAMLPVLETILSECGRRRPLDNGRSTMDDPARQSTRICRA